MPLRNGDYIPYLGRPDQVVDSVTALSSLRYATSQVVCVPDGITVVAWGFATVCEHRTVTSVRLLADSYHL